MTANIRPLSQADARAVAKELAQRELPYSQEGGDFKVDRVTAKEITSLETAFCRRATVTRI